MKEEEIHNLKDSLEYDPSSKRQKRLAQHIKVRLGCFTKSLGSYNDLWHCNSAGRVP